MIVHDDNENVDEEDDYNEEDLAKMNKKGGKVCDHDHWNGEFRGAAHNGCNIAYRKVKKIHWFFQNLGGYDSSFIFENLEKVNCPDPQVIVKSMEKDVGFSIGNLQLKDSVQFLGESLEKLVQNLAYKATRKAKRMLKICEMSAQKRMKMSNYGTLFHHWFRNGAGPSVRTECWCCLPGAVPSVECWCCYIC